MAAKYELNDASVVVVVGSGAGGGTLANELCQKGVKVVCLEAGNHLTQEDFVNDEFAMWGKLTWQDPRTGQPIWIVKAVGGSTNHWAGLSIRMKDYELKTRTTYGAVAGANLLDWPISLKELEPYYDKAESKMGVTGTNGLPRQPETNAFKVVNYCAKKAGYSFEMGPSAINSVVRDGRPACQMIGFCTSGCKIGAKWSTLYTEIPKAMETGNFELRSQQHGAADPARRQGQGQRRALRRRERQAPGTEGADRLRRRELHREPAPAAELGLEHVQGRNGQLVGPGRPELHAARDPARLCDVRSAGPRAPGHSRARDHAQRGPARSLARLRGRLSPGDLRRSGCRSPRSAWCPEAGGARSPTWSTSTITWSQSGPAERICLKRTRG